MMRTDDEREEKPDPVSDRRLWQRCRLTDAPEDEALHFLDLAAFIDGLLDTEEQERVAVLLTADPDAAADVQTARVLDSTDQTYGEIERVIARACAILPGAAPARGRVISLAPRQRRRLVQDFAQWGSIAAAVAMASWLGFAMGSDASLALSDPRQPSDASFLPELFDPASGLLRDFGEGLRT